MVSNNVRRSISALALGIFIPFGTGYFLSYLLRTINGSLSDTLVDTFKLGPAILGLLTSAYFLTFAGAQLPIGVMLDRYGPRKVQAVLSLICAVGAAQFAVAPNVPLLVAGRALIGLGVSGALMTGLKSIASLWPKRSRPAANGCFIACGGLGAMASTVPTITVVSLFGWRATFGALAALSLIVALLSFTLAPEPPRDRPGEDWPQILAGLGGVYRDPSFWRIAPLSASVIGTAFAVHGLWAARWMSQVEHLSTKAVSHHLLAMGAGLTAGAVGIGVVSNRLLRQGIAISTIFGSACALFLAVQIVLLLQFPISPYLLWTVYAAFGSMTVLSYSMLGELFPSEMIGRANSALNVLHLGAAFAIQYGMGVTVGLWRPDQFGTYPSEGYVAAFAAALAIEVACLIWFLINAGRCSSGRDPRLEPARSRPPSPDSSRS